MDTDLLRRIVSTALGNKASGDELADVAIAQGGTLSDSTKKRIEVAMADPTLGQELVTLVEAGSSIPERLLTPIAIGLGSREAAIALAALLP